jgi:uncharacterized membrane protein
VTLYTFVLTVHIVSAAVLFGTGLGIAYFMFMAWRAQNVPVLAVTLRHVVRADFLFTAEAVLVQPVSGAALIVIVGHDPWAPWLLWSYGLFAVAGACWLPVVAIQLRLARLARTAANGGATALPPLFNTLMRRWFWLGWPAFLAVLAIYGLMVAKAPM